ncbi:MAG: hypothetical protein JNM81_14310 [Rhodospirillaceae bacterium]|nr:hypothetical protein [Rhodospirillaceae bacterium]
MQIQSAALAFNVSRKRPSRVVPVHSFKRPKIRLGYFSADFYRHAAMNLMAELFELHDRSMFELVAVSYGFPHEDDVRARVKKAFDQFIEAKDMSDGDVAQRSRESEIDIAIDLTGHTAHSRVGIFARGVAPLQTQYLGFPGSMGSSVYDYVIGDRIVIPEREIQNYPEKIIFMPDCFQVNDRSRVVAAPKNRTEYGLPDEGFIFASFNQSHKFNPPRFKLWMSILRQVPGSVLWLVSTHPLQIANLRAFAGECGVDPNRIIFASQIAYADHLARYQIVDLALDTLPFNGGATTSDALWAGAPVLTQVGDSYAGRMTASLLTAAGLPELVTESPAAYERLAVELALERQKLKLMRQTLAANRLTCSLFDSRRFTRHLEIAYQQIWQRHKSGQTPDHIYVSAVP